MVVMWILYPIGGVNCNEGSSKIRNAVACAPRSRKMKANPTLSQARTFLCLRSVSIDRQMRAETTGLEWKIFTWWEQYYRQWWSDRVQRRPTLQRRGCWVSLWGHNYIVCDSTNRRPQQHDSPTLQERGQLCTGKTIVFSSTAYGVAVGDAPALPAGILKLIVGMPLFPWRRVHCSCNLLQINRVLKNNTAHVTIVNIFGRRTISMHPYA